MSLESWKRRRHSKLQQADDVLCSAFKQLRVAKKIKKYSALPPWEQVVGETLARVSKPEKIANNNVLVIRVIDGAYSHELSLKKQEIIEKLFQLSPTLAIEDLRFISGSPKDFKKNPCKTVTKIIV